MEYFCNPIESYTRNLNIIGGYQDQTALYYSVMKNKPFEKMRAFIKHKMETDPKFTPKNPRVMYLEKTTPGNREKHEGTLLDFIENTVSGRHPMSPSMTTYIPVDVQESLMGKFLVESKKKRSGYKHKQFEAKQDADYVKEMFYYNLQTYLKVINNSFSGAQSSPYNPLYNKSGHSTLTSVGASAICYSNASNERLLAGNRHYWSSGVVTTAILATVQHTDYARMEEAMQKYNMHYPTTDNVMEMISECTHAYFRNGKFMEQTRLFVDRLTPIQRAAVLYKGDLHHIAKYNHDVVYAFLDEMSSSSMQSMEFEEAKVFMKSLNYDTTILSYLLCSDFLKGKKIADVMANDPYHYGVIAATAKHVLDTLDKYHTFIKGFLIPETLPPSIHKFTSIVRKAVVVSDTDSSIFTTQEWVKWFTGKIGFSKKSYNIGYVMTFLASQMVAHVLRLLCANLGVAPQHMGTLSMKNEFYYPLFVLTSSAKNYFAYESACEGVVYNKMELTLKGVQLRGSNTPEIVNNTLKDYITMNMDAIIEERDLTMDQIIMPIVELETRIMADLDAGGRKYLATAQIKDSEAYAKEEEASPWQYHRLWEEVFSAKYGSPGNPPYDTIKLYLELGNKTAIKRWLERIEDISIRDKMTAWITENDKKMINMLTVPEEVVIESGIPIELSMVLDKRKNVAQLSAPLHHVVESFGIYVSNKKTDRLFIDSYTPTMTVQ